MPLFFTSCGGKKTITNPNMPVTLSAEQQEMKRQITTDINRWKQAGLHEGRAPEASKELSRLAKLAKSKKFPELALEAKFQRAHVLLHNSDARGLEEAKDLHDSVPNYVKIPNLYIWQSILWQQQGNNDARILAATAAAFIHPYITFTITRTGLKIGKLIAERSNDWEALQWYLAAAQADLSGRDDWLQRAAVIADLAMLDRLRQLKIPQSSLRPRFYRFVAHQALQRGDFKTAQLISKWLEDEVESGEESLQVQKLVRNATQPLTLGVLLPLSGKYSRYGQESLRGIRIALARQVSSQTVQLRIEDTAGDMEKCQSSYARLQQEGVRLIIGPLLANCARTLAKTAKTNEQPVLISMTSQDDVAYLSPNIFVHTLSLSMQARFMAAYALAHKQQRIAVVYEANAKKEAEAFRQAMVEGGGEVVAMTALPYGVIDVRKDLQRMLLANIDEVIQAEFAEELNVFIPYNRKMEILPPPNFDAVYLASSGGKVALLAGQLLYVGIRHASLYGSSRWRDGHLLDDRGRYLSRARFADAAPAVIGDIDAQSVHYLHNQTWGGNSGKLSILAYDTAMLAIEVMRQFVISPTNINQYLQRATGFSAISGNVIFDKNGIGKKTFVIYGIKSGTIQLLDEAQ
ncbi:MAG: penicillin-binding protein activator [Mariprofundales bacterium]